jgi:alpha-galactosidase
MSLNPLTATKFMKYMRPVLAAFALAACVSSTAAPSQKWDDDPNGIKVFILAGQSNMVGYGKVEEGGNPAWKPGDKETPKEIKGGVRCLREMAINNAKYPEYDYTSLLVDPKKPETSAWKTRPDVKLWWRDGGSGNLGGDIRKGDLGPLTNNNKWFGPELGFGQIIGDHYKDQDVLIIKAAWGGRSLGVDFRPPSAVAARGGEVGLYYLSIFEHVREALINLGRDFPEWKGKGYQIAGFAWHQGFNDRVSKELAAEYRDNLVDLIKDVRAEFGKPDLPFVIATTGMGNAGPVGNPPYENYTPVERAQLWVAGVDKPANVLATDTRPFWTEPKDSPSTMGHHWNHSAQSYFRVGKALGDDMVKLLGK